MQNEINKHALAGQNVSYILTIHTDNPATKEEIRRRIHGKTIMKTVKNTNVPLTWYSSHLADCIYYAYTAGMLGDVAVKNHTSRLFAEELTDLGKIDFCLSRPLMQEFSIDIDD